MIRHPLNYMQFTVKSFTPENIKIPALMLFMLLFSSTAVKSQSSYTKDQLIGKGTPMLFGEGKLQKKAFEAFEKMKAAAAKEGYKIKVVSGYRNFSRQKAIFERKYKKYTAQGMGSMPAIKKIIEYSTIPGTSRHHWGTDIDIIDDNATYSGDVLVPEKFHGNGPFCKLREWLEKHANDFGFYIVYTANKDRKGFKYEPWHYTYAPISIPMLKAYREKINLKEILTQEKLLGASSFTDEFIEQYYKENILDINPVLK